jgi:hypothetical protein
MGRSATYHPRVRFTTVDGLEVEFTSQKGGSFIPAVGSEVKVMYSRNDPKVAELHPLTAWGGSVLAVLALAFFGGLGGVLIRLGRALRPAPGG